MKTPKARDGIHTGSGRIEMKIAVAGTGYVGMSIAVLLAQKNKVVALDVVEDKVA